jgi:hypothetical protein
MLATCKVTAGFRLYVKRLQYLRDPMQPHTTRNLNKYLEFAASLRYVEVQASLFGRQRRSRLKIINNKKMARRACANIEVIAIKSSSGCWVPAACTNPCSHVDSDNAPDSRRNYNDAPPQIFKMVPRRMLSLTACFDCNQTWKVLCGPPHVYIAQWSPCMYV